MTDLYETRTTVSFTSSRAAIGNEAKEALTKIEIPRDQDITRMVFGI
jgi:hypothetical protein